MKTAKEMFEGIGYKLSEAYSEDTLISYFDGKKNITIEFYIKNKQFRKARGVFDCVDIKESELKAIIQQCKELGWLEEEKQEIKQETNYEHYKDGIIELCVDDLAISKGKISECNAISCRECFFVDKDGMCIGCNEIKKWLKQPYKKPPYKLSQFEYDLIQTYSYVHEGYTLSKFNRLIKLKDKGYFKGVDEDTAIHDILANCEVREDGNC